MELSDGQISEAVRQRSGEFLRLGPVLSLSLILSLILLLGCRLGVAVEKTSADGRFVASVVNAPSLDPPRQSLWLADRREVPVKLIDLAEDQESCSRIAWAESRSETNVPSSIVAFGIDPPRAVVVEAESKRMFLDQRLPDDETWTTDSSLGAFELIRSDETGTELVLRYRICRRGDLDCPSAGNPWRELPIPS